MHAQCSNRQIQEKCMRNQLIWICNMSFFLVSLEKTNDVSKLRQQCSLLFFVFVVVAVTKFKNRDPCRRLPHWCRGLLLLHLFMFLVSCRFQADFNFSLGLRKYSDDPTSFNHSNTNTQGIRTGTRR